MEQQIIKDAAYFIGGYDTYLHLTVEENGTEFDNSSTWCDMALDYRDEIENLWDELTDTQKESVKKLDDYLRLYKNSFKNQFAVIGHVEEFNPPKSHWWWYLPLGE
jgi:adenosine deaminase